MVKQIADHFAAELGDGPIGITVPAVVTHGRTRSAANIDPAWVDAPAEDIFREALGRPITLVNDADAAGIAEVLSPSRARETTRASSWSPRWARASAPR